MPHDQTQPELNKGLSDFHRKHRLILSWAWDLPFRATGFVEGWQIAGIGTFQSGRPSPCSTTTSAASSSRRRIPRPNLAPGMTHEDQTTSGSVTDRLDNYLNPDAFVSSVERFGNLGRNTVIGPAQKRVDVSISKMTRFSRQPVARVPGRSYNITNTPSFRQSCERLERRSNFGQITRTRGGPRVMQLGLKFRF